MADLTREEVEDILNQLKEHKERMAAEAELDNLPMSFSFLFLWVAACAIWQRLFG